MAIYILVERYGERTIVLGQFPTRLDAFKEMQKYERVTDHIDGVHYEILEFRA